MVYALPQLLRLAFLGAGSGPGALLRGLFVGDLARAVAFGADGGRDAAAQDVLGECYLGGFKGLSTSSKLGAEWLAKAASAGIAQAQQVLGALHGTGQGVALDLTETVRLYRRAAKQGQRGDILNLACCLVKGEGCDADPVQAVQWMRALWSSVMPMRRPR